MITPERPMPFPLLLHEGPRPATPPDPAPVPSATIAILRQSTPVYSHSTSRPALFCLRRGTNVSIGYWPGQNKKRRKREGASTYRCDRASCGGRRPAHTPCPALLPIPRSSGGPRPALLLVSWGGQCQHQSKIKSKTSNGQQRTKATAPPPTPSRRARDRWW